MLTDDEIRRDLARLKDLVAAHKAPDAPLATHSEIIDGVEYDVFSKAPVNLGQLYELGMEQADETFLVYQEERYLRGNPGHGPAPRPGVKGTLRHRQR